MGNVLSSLSNKFNTLSVNASDKKKSAISGLAGLSVLGAATVPIFADDPAPAGDGGDGGGGSGGFQALADAVKSVFKEFYDSAKGIISVIAIGLIVVCLILRLISKDQRKVDEATAWMKRIIVTWLIFLFLGVFQDLIEGIGADHGAEADMG